ncbi:GGDEF domain-containing protein [Parasphingorhabdus sp.]|uniref:GGDEF domain-containing protein n=1 Tax=Parasphingorhabdus sp. TaxID=2709688 RepID=UPI00326343E1
MSDDKSRHQGAMKECENCEELQNEIRHLESRLQEMEQMAHHDVLTGLPNRRHFIKALENRVTRCLRYGDTSALLFLDVNNLKKINDAHGHGAGDLILAHLAQLLRTYIRQSDLAARIGGDEFAMLLDNLDADHVENKIAFLLERFASAHVQHESEQIPLRVAIGYCFVGPRDTVTELLSRADAAMYATKGAD